MAGISYRGQVTGGTFTTGIAQIELFASASGITLLTDSGENGGYDSYRLTAGALPALVDTQRLVSSGPVLVPSVFGIARHDDEARLVSPGGTALAVQELAADGSIRRLDETAGPGRATAFASDVDAGGQTLFVAAADGLRSYRIGADLSLTLVSGPVSRADYGGQTAALAVSTIGGQSFLLSASAFGDGVASWRIDPATGQLTARGAVGAAEGLGLDAPASLEAVSLGGRSFVVVAGNGSGSLSVLELAADGSLTPVDHVIDTLATRFGAVTALDVVVVNGRALVLAGGGDDGLTLFELLPDGRLVWRETLPDSATLRLADVSAIRAVATGSELQIFTASASEPGLSQFVLSLAALGGTRTAGAAGGTLDGTWAEDLLIGGAGADIVSGGGGDDILVDGAGNDRLRGGAGADVFVLVADDAYDVISDFEAGTDRLDLSNWPMLHSPAALDFQSTGGGALLSWRGETLELQSADGRPLSRAQVFPAGFEQPDRPLLVIGPAPPPPATAGPDLLVLSEAGLVTDGLGGNDTIAGTIGPDTILGGDGNDVIDGGDWADRLLGGRGDDTLRGGAGDDFVSGEAGRDRAMLGPGDDRYEDRDGGDTASHDRVWGYLGNDTILCALGNDTLWGEAGEDSLEGGAGDDELWGGSGFDTLRGGDGNDRLGGGDGRDLIFMGNGDDWASDSPQEGPKGNDTFYAGPGDDTVLARGGDDLLWGEDGNDSLEGGVGNDTVWGGAGDDIIRSGDGDDVVRGETGRDRVMLGAGDDLFEDVAEGGPGGADMVWGYDGDDTIRCDGGADSLWGEAGNDLLEGGADDDMIYGGAGQDRLRGGTGDDVMVGGTGADTFSFRFGDGDDRIFDYEPGRDRLSFEGFASPPSILFEDAGQGAVLLDYGGGTILLDGVTAAQLTAADFLFG